MEIVLKVSEGHSMANATVETATGDDDLLEAVAQKRDREAFAELYRRHEQAAFNLACHITRDRDAAEEALQEALLRAWKSADSYRAEGSARGWFLRIVARESLRKARHRRKERSAMQANERLELQAASAAEGPEWERGETLTVLRRMLEQLPDLDRQLLALHFGAGLSQEEAGTALALSQQAISFRMKKALEHLRAGLTRAGLAGAVGLVEAGGLSEALCSGRPLPPGLTAKVLGNFAQAAQHSMRMIVPAGFGVSSTLLAGGVLAAVLAVVALGSWWRGRDLTQAPESSPAALPPALPREEPTKPSDEPLHMLWTFEKGAPQDLEVVQGTWKWNAASGNDPARMTGPENEQVYLLLPTQIPSRPVVLSAKLKLGSGTSKVRKVQSSVSWTDGRMRLACQAWNTFKNSPVRPEGSARSTVLFFCFDRWIVAVTNDSVCGLQEFASAYPARQLLFGTRNYDLEELELRSLNYSEIPVRVRETEKLIPELTNGPRTFEAGYFRKSEPDRTPEAK